ncbi:MAG TPA: glycerophosphodiester phosphodiesterase family protein [Natronosporangium sp.]
MSKRVAVSAHRGGGEDHPRGTWEAYQSALDIGAEYVEFDVRKLRDGTLVCFHDPRTSRDGPALATLSYRELCDAVGYEVPTVPAVLKLLAGRAIGHVDLKETGYEPEVVRLVLAALGPGGFVVTSLEDESIARVSTEFPEVRTALSLGRGRAELSAWQLPFTRLRELLPLRRIRACGAQWVAVDKNVARRGVLWQCARHGIGAMVWTVDEPELIDRFLTDSRVDVLVTNRPRFALDRRRQLS